MEFGLKLQGEEQKKLDVLSNDVFINALISSGRTVSCCCKPCKYAAGLVCLGYNWRKMTHLTLQEQTIVTSYWLQIGPCFVCPRMVFTCSWFIPWILSKNVHRATLVRLNHVGREGTSLCLLVLSPSLCLPHNALNDLNLNFGTCCRMSWCLKRMRNQSLWRLLRGAGELLHSIWAKVLHVEDSDSSDGLWIVCTTWLLQSWESIILLELFLSCRYCVVFDPLDGSSNIDCGVSIGTVIQTCALALQQQYLSGFWSPNVSFRRQI